MKYPLRSATLLAGPIVTVASFGYSGGLAPDNVAVTSTTGFVGSIGSEGSYLGYFAFATPGTVNVSSQGCEFLTSDTNAIYCAQASGSNQRIASDGTVSSLGAAVQSSSIVVDDTDAYWADRTVVGTIMKAPKTGGGSATIVARDTSPTAIAIDAHSVYWADAAGYIKSVPK